MLALEDLKGLTEKEVKAHLAQEYAGSNGNYASDDERTEYAKLLRRYRVLIAYESVGSWGCDSASFFLLRRNSDGKPCIITGSHCSCHGFEGQGDIEESDWSTLTDARFWVCLGGYDSDHDGNEKAIRDRIAKLAPHPTQGVTE